LSARLGAGLDWKTSLQELTAAEILGVPEYHVEESGPDHQKSFRAFVRIGAQTYGEGAGRSKKEAEQQAAEAAWNAISERLAADPANAASPASTAGPVGARGSADAASGAGHRAGSNGAAGRPGTSGQTDRT
jgi:ribonuclease-3